MTSREALREFEKAIRLGRFAEVDVLRSRLNADLRELEAWKAMMTSVFVGDRPDDREPDP